MSFNLSHLVYTFEVEVEVSNYDLREFIGEIKDRSFKVENAWCTVNGDYITISWVVPFPLEMDTYECDKFLQKLTEEFVETYYDYVIDLV